MITENLSTLKIHKLTREQYNREKVAGRIDESAIYLFTDDVVDGYYDLDLTDVVTFDTKQDSQSFGITNDVDPVKIEEALNTNKAIRAQFKYGDVKRTVILSSIYNDGGIDYKDDDDAIYMLRASGLISIGDEDGGVCVRVVSLTLTYSDGAYNCLFSNWKHDINTDETLSKEGHPADAKVVGDALNAIPVSVVDDGYTNIMGIRQATSINVVKSDQTITVTSTMTGGTICTDVITLNEEGYPTSISVDDTHCTVTWDGFDE